MDIVVRREGDNYTAAWGAGPRQCAVGRGGIGEKLREGDGITPIGRWPLRRVLYRADRMPAPGTNLPLSAIAPDDAWCDVPGDPNYNRPVRLPYPSLDERLWRQDSLYDLIMIVGFNDDPVLAGKGSAIFVHVARPDYAPTEGCVALARDDLLEALAQLGPADELVVST
jgi:L,D-peptidoglycan transpeptidase YkuD (ErfK/YbiS/YcfS/YnhG family)